MNAAKFYIRRDAVGAPSHPPDGNSFSLVPAVWKPPERVSELIAGTPTCPVTHRLIQLFQLLSFPLEDSRDPKHVRNFRKTMQSTGRPLNFD